MLSTLHSRACVNQYGAACIQCFSMQVPYELGGQQKICKNRKVQAIKEKGGEYIFIVYLGYNILQLVHPCLVTM
jgi:hypothetical protein